MDIIWSGLFYIFGCGFSTLLSVCKFKAKIDNSEVDFGQTAKFALISTFTIIVYMVSSWIGVVDIIIDSTIEYCKSKTKNKKRKISDEKISGWFKK